MRWDATTESWTKGAGNVVWLDSRTDSEAVFGTTGVGSITVDATRDASSLRIQASGYQFSGGTINLGGGGLIVGTNVSASIGSLLAGTGSLYVNSGAMLTLNAPSSPGGSTLSGSVFVNGGTLRLAGVCGFDEGYFKNQPTTYTIGTGGTLELASSWNASSKATYAIEGGTLKTSTTNDSNYVNTLAMTAGSITGTGGIRTGNIGAPTWTINASSTGSTISAPVGLVRGSATTLLLNVADGTAAADLTISGAISDVNNYPGLGIEKRDAGTLVLSGTNTYTGSTIVSEGVLQTAGGNAIPDASDVTVNATWKLSGAGETIKGLNGNGAVQLHESTTGGKTLTVGAGNGNGTFAGTLNNGGGTLSLAKIGGGTQTLNGAGNSLMSGSVTVEGGTLRLAAVRDFNLGFFQNQPTTYTIQTGASLELAGDWNTSSNAIYLIDNGTLRTSTSGDLNYVNKLTMTAGAITGTGGIRTGYFFTPIWTINASSAGTTISTPVGLVKGSAAALMLDVADGAAAIDLTISGVISDVSGHAGLGITKNGDGTLTLSAMNTYVGPTTVNRGTLYVTGRLANNGADKVFLAADTDGDTSFSGPLLVRAMGPLGNDYTGLGSTSTGGRGTTAQLRAGANTAGQGPDTVGMTWRTPSTADVVPQGLLVSDVLRLAGMENNLNGAGQTDPFVLQMSYDESQVGGLESGYAASGMLFLAWWGPDGWCNAVSGDSGSGRTAVAQYQGTWDTFAAVHGITNATLGDFLGSWGVNPTDNTVWAVLDHNSDFAVAIAAPEPGTLAIFLAGLLAGQVLLPRIRRRNVVLRS
jgi:autotransporter-associated beta strand protein